VQKKIMQEFWTSIPGSKKYQISSCGKVRRITKKGYRELKPYKKRQWLAIKVDFQGKYKEYILHKLMAKIFLPEPKHGQVVYHINGILTDNHECNLAYIDRSELGKMSGPKTSRSIPVVQIDPETNEIINFYKSIAAAARDNYIHKETICQAIRGELKTAAGFKWRKDTY